MDKNVNQQNQETESGKAEYVAPQLVRLAEAAATANSSTLVGGDGGYMGS